MPFFLEDLNGASFFPYLRPQPSFDRLFLYLQQQQSAQGNGIGRLLHRVGGETLLRPFRCFHCVVDWRGSNNGLIEGRQGDLACESNGIFWRNLR
jgi:hypothetical protein